MDRRRKEWAPDLIAASRPLYLGIVDQLAADVRTGVLAPGTRLPTHRNLARLLGVDVTTISRAYGEARRRGLVAGRVGRGTFVRGGGSERSTVAELVDLTTNTPPDDDRVVQRFVASMFRGLRDHRDAAVTGYSPIGGADEDRAAAAEWLAQHGLNARADRVLVASCGQQAFVSILSAHCEPGDIVLTEASTYPGFMAAARLLHLRLVAVESDEGGIDPGNAERLARRHRPKALMLVPTLHNPTGITLSAGRRARLATVARKHGMIIIEDDAYGPLHESAPRPIADLAPDVTYLVATASKVLLPLLRWCAIAAPTPALARRVETTLRATGWMQSAFESAIARRLLSSDGAVRILASRRREAAVRMADAVAALGVSLHPSRCFGHHVWLDLPSRWPVRDFVDALRRERVLVTGGDAFTLDPGHPARGVRICLGAVPRALLKPALECIATTLQGSPVPHSPSH